MIPERVPTPLPPSGTAQRYRFHIRERKNPAKLKTVTIEVRDLETTIKKIHDEEGLIVSAEPIPERHFTIPRSFGDWFLLLTGRSAEIGSHELKSLAPIVPIGSKKKVFPLHFFPRVSTRELISFAIQLSALLHAGVPLLRSLETVQRGAGNAYFQSVLERCIQAVRQGFSFHHAIREHPKVFPPIWHNLVEVGETAGTLADVLKEIARYQEAAQRVKSKTISAFFYPTMLILFATCAVGFLLMKIIPQFEVLFQSTQAELPFITKVVISVSKILRSYFLVFLFIVSVLITALIYMRRTKRGRFFLDLVKLKYPLMGTLILQASMVRFARGLSILINSGVAILQALEISGRLSGNAVVEETVCEAEDAVRGGRGLGPQLESSGLFPVFMTQLVTVGEEAGELARFLDLIANYYEERIDTFLSRLTTLLEPILLIAVGSVIGVLVVSMILPIIEFSTGMHA